MGAVDGEIATMKRTYWRGIALAMLTVAFSRSVQAAPVYDPDSKSYFEMVDGREDKQAAGMARGQGPDWAEAFLWAKEREYKGAKGRLAIVKNIATHEFLERTFAPGSDVWIGLRYWCQVRKLQWSDGEMVSPGTFQAWAVNWRQDIYACNSGGGPTDYMPIAYNPIADGFRWIGKGKGKRYYFYFVEYPTGHP
jgi:hypothetical protein